jgi:hypothetical protein
MKAKITISQLEIEMEGTDSKSLSEIIKGIAEKFGVLFEADVVISDQDEDKE